VNPLDIILGVVLLSAVIGGYRLGFVARVASWLGGVGGFYFAMRVLPIVLRRAGQTAGITRLFISLGVLLLGAAIGGTIGEVLGSTLRKAMPIGPVRMIDHLGGAAVGLAGVLIGVWLFLPVVAQVPGDAARLARTSKIVTAVHDIAPEPPDTTRTLRRLVGDARIPDVFADLRPAPDTGPPPSAVPVDPAIVARAVASTANIESFGCGGLHEGSAFAVAENTLVTNAHVVAGGERIRARLANGRLLKVTVVMFDKDKDIAVLDVRDLRLPPLAISTAKAGSQGAVLGYPGGQNTVRVAPAVVRQKAPAVGKDIYDRSTTRREVLFMASNLRPGDSGSALIDTAGSVMGVAFAIAPDRPGTSYALADSELRSALAEPRAPGAGGPCV